MSRNIRDCYRLKLDRKLWPFPPLPNRRSKRNQRYGERSNYPEHVDYTSIVEPFQRAEELIDVRAHRSGIQSQSVVSRKACCAR